MAIRHGPIYEFTLFVEGDVADGHERWLDDRIRDALRLPGMLDCRRFSIAADEQGRAGHICQFVLNSNEALDDFIDDYAADFDSDATSQFGDRMAMSSRILREDKTHGRSIDEVPDCLNCGAHLRGQYCGHCGQRSRSRLISLWELIRDAFGDLFELDSRLWQTLVPLTIRPGQLTRDYLQGRRARYMPPFRMYLVLSLLFFLVAFFDPHEKLGVLFEPDAETTAEQEVTEETHEADHAGQETLNGLAADGIIVGSEALPEDVADELGAFNIQLNEHGDPEVNCEVDKSDLDGLPDWLSRRLTPERLQRVCERTKIDDGRALIDNLIDNIPAALIVLLPLMAFVLKGLYPLSRRYYVEHVLFFVHFHAFFFLILSLEILFSRITTLLHVPEAVADLALVIVSFYIPVYLYVSMRRVYGQGRAVTFLKYIVLTVAYAFGLLVTMLGAVAIAAFSI